MERKDWVKLEALYDDKDGIRPVELVEFNVPLDT